MQVRVLSFVLNKMILHTSKGKLRYDITEDAGYKLIVEVDLGIVQFYRALIPPWYPKINPQKYRPHISVVRNEIPPNKEVWRKYEGDEVEFLYSNIVHSGTVYWWLNCFSVKLEEIRLELGLPVDSPYTRPPDGLKKTFHCTIGNIKS